MTRLSSVFLLGFLLAACAGRGGLAPEEAWDAAPAEGGGADVAVNPLDEDCQPPCAFRRADLDDPTSPLAQRMVFFDFDSALVKPEYEPVIRAHAQYLLSYPDVKVRLEGHTDERGSREYNLALGEERAKAVRRMLVLQGVPEAQISVISFGEEIPLDPGHDESAWAQNRRVEFVYDQMP
ncbi:MAG: hypothetical protein KatS3mg121_0346 [Gammaproteobacteria bacterium]|nr:MAG: hypothetical protein KatS3mg121_0346 [Gammaproteobacteria bacterium]